MTEHQHNNISVIDCILCEQGRRQSNKYIGKNPENTLIPCQGYQSNNIIGFNFIVIAE